VRAGGKEKNSIVSGVRGRAVAGGGAVVLGENETISHVASIGAGYRAAERSVVVSAQRPVAYEIAR